MGGRGGQSLREQSGAMKQAAAVGAGIGPMGASEIAAGEGVFGPDGTGIPPPHGHGHGHGIRGLCGRIGGAIGGPLIQILGLDRFTRGKALGGMRRAGMDQNPFDMGFIRVCLSHQRVNSLQLILQNCRDFWWEGNANVDYTKLYEIPPEGECFP